MVVRIIRDLHLADLKLLLAGGTLYLRAQEVVSDDAGEYSNLVEVVGIIRLCPEAYVEVQRIQAQFAKGVRADGDTHESSSGAAGKEGRAATDG